MVGIMDICCEMYLNELAAVLVETACSQSNNVIKSHRGDASCVFVVWDTEN